MVTPSRLTAREGAASSPTAIASGFKAALALGPQPRDPAISDPTGRGGAGAGAGAGGYRPGSSSSKDGALGGGAGAGAGAGAGGAGGDAGALGFLDGNLRSDLGVEHDEEEEEEDVSDEDDSEDGDADADGDDGHAADGTKKRGAGKGKGKGKGKKAGGKKKDAIAQQHRKVQNRIAQREFRQRKQQYIRALEARVELLSSDHDTQVDRLRFALRSLITENNQLRAIVGSLSAFIGEGAGSSLTRLKMSQEELDGTINMRSEKTVTDAWAAYRGTASCPTLQELRAQANIPPDGLPESRYNEYANEGQDGALAAGKKGKRKAPGDVAAKAKEAAPKKRKETANSETTVEPTNESVSASATPGTPSAPSMPSASDTTSQAAAAQAPQTSGPQDMPTPLTQFLTGSLPFPPPGTFPPGCFGGQQQQGYEFSMGSNPQGGIGIQPWDLNSIFGTGDMSGVSQQSPQMAPPQPQSFQDGQPQQQQQQPPSQQPQQMNQNLPAGVQYLGGFKFTLPETKQSPSSSTSGSGAERPNCLSGGHRGDVSSMDQGSFAQEMKRIHLVVARINHLRERFGRRDFLPGPYKNENVQLTPDEVALLKEYEQRSDFPVGIKKDGEELERLSDAVTSLSYHMYNFRRNPSYKLPPMLKPTALQQSTPHDRVIDAFPFPGLRDGIVLNQEHLDMDEVIFSFIENTELHQGDVMQESSWELHLPFMLKHPELVDERTLANTNRWRAERGEARISIEDIRSMAGDSSRR